MSNNNFYTSTGKQVLDFFIGFCGELALLIFAPWLINYIPGLENIIDINISIIYICLFLISLVLSIILMRGHRHYIGIGMIVVYALPMIIGGCMLISGV